MPNTSEVKYKRQNIKLSLIHQCEPAAWSNTAFIVDGIAQYIKQGSHREFWTFPWPMRQITKKYHSSICSHKIFAYEKRVRAHTHTLKLTRSFNKRVCMCLVVSLHRYTCHLHRLRSTKLAYIIIWNVWIGLETTLGHAGYAIQAADLRTYYQWTPLPHSLVAQPIITSPQCITLSTVDWFEIGKYRKRPKRTIVVQFYRCSYIQMCVN